MDKYYKTLVEKYGTALLEKAGYFVEKNLPLVPVEEKLDINHSGEVILLTTGSFAPMHQGHVNMMDKAREFYEAQGIRVAASIFSFSHDDYVLTKDVNIPNKELRIKIAQDRLKDKNHQLSLWELFQLKPVNFTTVIEYFEKTYQKPVVYVFGKDNYYFAYTFNSIGKGLYMPTKHINSKEYKFIETLTNVKILPEGDFLLNSRDIRSKIYVLRDDSFFLKNKFNIEKLKEFSNSLTNLIKKYSNHEVLKVKAEDQIQMKFSQKTISLDLYFKGNYQLEISREFNFQKLQSIPNSLTPRLGAKPLDKQLKNIPKGEYILVDDDIASGYTINRVKELASKHGIIITQEVALNPVSQDNLYDIVDLRDFIIGATQGGLQVRDKKEVFKVPYLYPYVDLNSRAKILYDKEFSLEVLKLNYELYKNSKITLNELKEHKTFLQKIGFSKSLSVEEIILKLIKDLK